MNRPSNRLFLLRELVKRDFEARYAGSLLGFVWSFVQPLGLLALFTFAFSTVMKIPLTGARTDHFAIFLFCGLLPWTAIQEGIQRGAVAVTDNATLVKKLAFPAELLVFAPVATALLHQLIGLVAFGVVLAFLGQLAPTHLVLLLAILPLQLGLTAGLALLLGAIHVYYRDIAQALGLGLQVWFYLTPIVYPLSIVPEPWQPMILANPLTPLVDLYRLALLGGPWEVPPGTPVLALLAVGVAGLGLWTFRHLEGGFADVI